MMTKVLKLSFDLRDRFRFLEEALVCQILNVGLWTAAHRTRCARLCARGAWLLATTGARRFIGCCPSRRIFRIGIQEIVQNLLKGHTPEFCVFDLTDGLLSLRY